VAVQQQRVLMLRRDRSPRGLFCRKPWRVLLAPSGLWCVSPPPQYLQLKVTGNEVMVSTRRSLV
jgi:hypothetical protein